MSKIYKPHRPFVITILQAWAATTSYNNNRSLRLCHRLAWWLRGVTAAGWSIRATSVRSEVSPKWIDSVSVLAWSSLWKELILKEAYTSTVLKHCLKSAKKKKNNSWERTQDNSHNFSFVLVCLNTLFSTAESKEKLTHLDLPICLFSVYYSDLNPVIKNKVSKNDLGL